jgi:RNA polymerase sigma-70 factor, ECF subfamily
MPETAALPFDVAPLRPLLHRYCTRMVGSVLDGEDIVQEALLRALEAMPADTPIGNPGGWLFRIAHNVALDFLRRRARQAETLCEDDVEELAHPIDEQGRREAAAAGLHAFMQLPTLQRSAVILFDVLEYSADEIGEILGTTAAAVKSALQRGRSSLRNRAQQPPRTAAPALSAERQRLLHAYVSLFNARDFDTLRAMLAADVRLDLVNRLQAQGQAVGEYFSRYSQAVGWHATAGLVEGRPALLMHRDKPADAPPDYVVVLEWREHRVASIRDFLFAPYVMDSADVQRL